MISSYILPRITEFGTILPVKIGILGQVSSVLIAVDPH